MGCFGSGESQEAKDNRVLVERFRKEIGVLKQDKARLERELKDAREASALQQSEKDDDIVAVRDENEHLRGQLERATEKEEGVAEYTVSLIKEIADLKGKLRSSGGGERDEARRGDETTAKYEEEIQHLRNELNEAKDEARGYSEEIGDLAKQIIDLQQKSLDAAAYRKEIQHLKMIIGGEESSSPETSGVSGGGVSSSAGDCTSCPSGFSESIEVVRTGSASSSERNAALDASVISTVSLTSGFFGDGANELITLSKADANDGTPTKAARSSVVTPPGTSEEPGVHNVPPIDADVVVNAVKCVEEIIRRVNRTKTIGTTSRKELFKTKPQSFEHEEKNIEFVGMPLAKGEIVNAESSIVSPVSFSTTGKRDSSKKDSSENENSSFYSAASAEGAKKVVDCSSLQVAVETKSSKSPSQPNGVLDTSSWKPVGTTGALLLVSDESTIDTEDVDYDDEIQSCHSAYSAPVSNIKSRSDSAVIVAELYRVQSLLCSVLKSTPNESMESDSEHGFSAQDFVRVKSLPSFNSKD